MTSEQSKISGCRILVQLDYESECESNLWYFANSSNRARQLWVVANMFIAKEISKESPGKLVCLLFLAREELGTLRSGADL